MSANEQSRLLLSPRARGAVRGDAVTAPPPDIPFDRTLRRLRRDRASTGDEGAYHLLRRAADEIMARLDASVGTFVSALDLGTGPGLLASQLRARGIRVIPADAGAFFAAASGGVQCDEDRLPFADHSFDLAVSVGSLDTVNDLPGALSLIRRTLKPGGLFLAACVGGPLPRLRQAMRAAEAAAHVPASPRIHPRLDVRAAGDLLLRTGFQLPVADRDEVRIRFASLECLVSDLRAMGLTNMLLERARRPLPRAARQAAGKEFLSDPDPDGRVSELFEIVYLSGWAPEAAA